MAGIEWGYGWEEGLISRFDVILELKNKVVVKEDFYFGCGGRGRIGLWSLHLHPALWTRTKPMQTTAWTGAEGWTQVLLGTSNVALKPSYGGDISE